MKRQFFKTKIKRAALGLSAMLMAATQIVSVLPAHAATVNLSIDGSQQNQTMTGLGVSVNSHSWDNGNLKPALDMLVDQNGTKTFRVVMEMSDWEASNDNADPFTSNWSYYDPIYSGATTFDTAQAGSNFADLWNTIDYLHTKGIPDNQIILSFMGIGPAWMGGATLNTANEDEWVETVVSAAYYGYTHGHTFGIFSPDNEEDWGNNEGIVMSSSLYADAMNRVANRLDAVGLNSMRLFGPDTAVTTSGYVSPMTNYPALMAKLDHFGFHNYSGTTSNASSLISGTGKDFWMNEYSIFGQSFQLLKENSAGLMMWDGYDSVYNHAILNNLGSQPGNDAGNAPALIAYNASTKTYSPRQSFYQFAQLYKYVPLGSVRIGSSTSSSTVDLVAFKDAASGRITIVGQNTSASAQTMNLALSNLGLSVNSLSYYQTNGTSNMAPGANVSVTNGSANVSVPGNTVFTLTGTGSAVIDTTPPAVSITSPSNGSTSSGSTAITAIASDNIGVAGVQFKVDGSNIGAEITSAPYTTNWDTTTTSNGAHAITAVARDAAGNATTSTVINTTVSNTSGTGGLLLGTQTVQPMADSNASGDAEAFKYTAAASGQANNVNFYVNSGSTATSLKVGIYTNNNGHPGTLLGSGSLASPAAGAWNSVPLTTIVSLSSGTTYWIGFLGTGGQLNYRDAASGSCSESASASNLSALPATWTSGLPWLSCQLSAYVNGVVLNNDTTAPTTTIVSPTDGSTVSGTATVSATASDDTAVTKVELYVDSVLKSSVTGSPFSFSLNTAQLGNGNHTLQTKAYDAAGNIGTSSIVTVSVQNDLTSPTVPTNVAATSGSMSQATLTWTAATDNVAVTGYHIWRNGAQIGSTSTLSYTDNGLAPGTTYQYTVSAYDAAGNESAQSIAASVTTLTDTTSPSVSISSPAAGASISGTVTVTASASDNVGIAGVQFKLDGSNLGSEDTSAPYSTNWSSTATTNGTHTLTAVARDTAGNLTTSSSVTITVSNTASALTLDKQVTTHQTVAGTSITSAGLTTSKTNDLLVAFITSDGPVTGGSQTFSSVTGGGLTWTLRKRVNTQAGTSEIWTAPAAATLTNVTVKATRSNGSYVGSITVAAFSNANTASIGAVGGASGATGASSASLTATKSGSLVWGVGNDWDGATSRTPSSGQTIVDQFLASVGDTFWVQSVNATSVAGQLVTVSDTAPTNHRWNLATIEILPTP